MHNDFYKRYVTDLPDHVWEDLAVSTILDPRFKNFDFPGATVEQRALAMGYLRSAWVVGLQSVSSPESCAAAQHLGTLAVQQDAGWDAAHGSSPNLGLSSNHYGL